MPELDPTDMLNRLVVAETNPGEFIGIGRVVGYQAAPTFLIERDDGTQFSWKADLCRRPTADELEAEILNRPAPKGLQLPGVARDDQFNFNPARRPGEQYTRKEES